MRGEKQAPCRATVGDVSQDERRTFWIVAPPVFLALVLGVLYSLPPERGKTVDAALRILAGDEPYREFWSMYAPGSPVLLAYLFRLFGRDLLVPAVAAALVHAASAGLAGALALRLGAAPRVSRALGLLLGLSAFRLSPELGSYPPALLLILCSVWQVFDWLEDGWARRLWHAGLLLGMAAVFKHDVAGYWMLGSLVALFLTHALAGPRRPAEWGSPLRACLILGAGGLAVVLPVALILAVYAGRDAWVDLIVFPLGDFRLVRAGAFPGLLPDLATLRSWLAAPGELGLARDAGTALSSWMLALAPQVAFAAGLVVLVLRRRALQPARIAMLALPLACLPFYWAAAHVQQNTHLTTMALASLWIAALLGAEFARSEGPFARLMLRALCALALFQGAGLLVRPAMEAWLLVSRAPSSVPLGLPGTTGVRVDPQVRNELTDIVRFVRASTSPRERIHCGVRFNDAVVISNPRFHALSERRPATRYSELHPGVTDREAVQREMIRDLENRHVRCAVIWTFGRHDRENAARIARGRRERIEDCGSGLLDAWFEQNFHPVLERGEYAVWWRVDARPPAALDPAGDPRESQGR